MKKLIPLLSALLVTAAIAAIIFTDSNPIQAIEKAPALFGLD